jgi:glycosyltransferase involved in cell wall biosynthesis
MPRHPLVSVVIPAYNAESFIDDALRSVLGQTYANLEIIVVDDASTDRTSARIAAYAPRVHCIRDAHSLGSASAPRNTGIGHCTGEYITFLDADDILLPDRIEKQVEFLSSHPEVELVFSDYRNFSSTGPADRSHFQTCLRLQQMLGDTPTLVLTSAEATALLAQENFGISGSFMIRETILKLETGFEPMLRACEDFHFYFRVARHGQVGVINEVGMLRRLHEDNMTSNPLRMLSEGIRSRTFLRDSENNSRIREYFDRYIAECHASLARYHAEHGDYLRAIGEDARALWRDSSGSRFWVFCRGVARTMAIAAGAHRPRVDES